MRNNNGCFLMMPLPTEATNEARKVSTDRCHPFHTYNTTINSDNLDSHNKTLQSTQTTWRGTWKSRLERSHWGIDRLLQLILSVILIVKWQSNFLVLQHKQTYLFSELFFIACHHWDKLQYGLGSRPKMCTWRNQNHKTTLPLVH